MTKAMKSPNPFLVKRSPKRNTFVKQRREVEKMVVDLLGEDWSHVEIADELGIPRTSVDRIVERLKRK